VGASGRRYRWSYHGEQEAIASLVTLVPRDEPASTRLALNSYCWPFLLSPGRLGLWCNEPRYIRLLAFELDALAAFPLHDIAGWFNKSQERVYSATPPLAEMELPWDLPAGSQPIAVPQEFRGVEELLIISSYKAAAKEEAANALFALRPAAGTVEVLPQKWFTAAKYDIGRQWLARVARDPATGRLVGEGVRIGKFELDDAGTDVARWLE
jgi:hypothetical protein